MNSPPDPKDEVHVEPADLGLIDVDRNLSHLYQQRAHLHHMRRHCHGDWWLLQKYIKTAIVGIPGKNLLLLAMYQCNCLIPSLFCSPKSFLSLLFPLKDLNSCICLYIFLAAPAVLYLHMLRTDSWVAIQRDQRGNARIWSDNLQQLEYKFLTQAGWRL